MSLLLVDQNPPPPVPAPLAVSRFPLRRDRPLCIGYGDAIRLGRADADYGAVRLEGERAMLWDGQRHEKLKVGKKLVDGRVSYALVEDRNGGALTDAQPFGPFIVFNPWATQALGSAQRNFLSVSTRGIRRDDAARTIVDVTAWMGNVRPRGLRRVPLSRGVEDDVVWEAHPSNAGVSLAQLVATNALADAGMDAAVASALVGPLVAALDAKRRGRRPTARTVVVDFEGAVRHFPEPDWGLRPDHAVDEVAALAEARMRLLVVFGALVGKLPAPDARVEDLLVPAAPDEEVARFIRALAPAAWADEQRLREEAALAVDALA